MFARKIGNVVPIGKRVPKCSAKGKLCVCANVYVTMLGLVTQVVLWPQYVLANTQRVYASARYVNLGRASKHVMLALLG